MIRLLFALLLMLSATAAAAAEDVVWRRSISRHFIVYSEAPVDELRRFTVRLERFDEVMRARLHLPDEDGARPLTIFLVRGQAEVAEAMGVSSETIFGFYAPAARGTIAVAPRRGAVGWGRYDTPAEQILFHEYVHHLLLDYFPAIYSRWCSEGFAELYSSMEFGEDDVVHIGKQVKGRLTNLSQLARVPLALMVSDKVGTGGDVSYDVLYAKGWFLTHFLSFNPRYAARLPAYAAALNAGKSDKAAMEGAFGTTLGAIDRELHDYLRRGKLPFLSVRVPQARSAAPRIEPVPPAQAALMPEWMLFSADTPKDRVKPLAVRVRAKAAAFAGDPFAERLVAEVELLAGRPAEAEAAADRALKAAPGDPRALLAKGRARIAALTATKSKDATAWTAARAIVARANRADPDDPLPLIVYYDSFKAADAEPPPIAAQGLARAAELAAQDDAVRLSLARDRWRRGDRTSAIETVRPAAVRPHRSPTTIAAAAQLAEWEKAAPAAAATSAE